MYHSKKNPQQKASQLHWFKLQKDFAVKFMKYIDCEFFGIKSTNWRSTQSTICFFKPLKLFINYNRWKM